MARLMTNPMPHRKKNIIPNTRSRGRSRPITVFALPSLRASRDATDPPGDTDTSTADDTDDDAA